jgi:hypothetical protein
MLTIQTNSELVHNNSIVLAVLNVTFVIFLKKGGLCSMGVLNFHVSGCASGLCFFCGRDLCRENKEVWSLAAQASRALKTNMPPFCNLHHVIEVKYK